MTPPIIGVTISREDGLVCHDTSTATAGIVLPPARGRGWIRLELERLDLIGGQYFVDVGAYRHDWAYAYDCHWHIYPFIVRLTDGDKGMCRPPHRWIADDPVALSADLSGRESA